MLNQRLNKALQQRTQAGNLRSLRLTSNLTDFYSNDYLGFSKNPDLQNQIQEEYQLFNNFQLGSTGSRLLSGNSEYAMNLEQQLASIFKAESTLLFNSGYTANASLIATITQKEDLILYDELIHASMREGYRLSFAQRKLFRHNDLEDLEKKLQQAKLKTVFVLLETVYSMDGDNAHLAEIVKLCKSYKANLIVDEAHSTGVYGENGNGLLCKLGLEKEVFAKVYTFGKGMGCHGACVVGSKVLTDYLINFSRGFIFTTAMPFHNLVSIKKAFDFAAENPHFQNQLQENIQYYKHKISTMTFDGIEVLESKTAIQALKISGNEKCRNLANSLIAKGFDVRPILSPTVKKGEERLRICLHSFNTKEEIGSLLENVARI